MAYLLINTLSQAGVPLSVLALFRLGCLHLLLLSAMNARYWILDIRYHLTVHYMAKILPKKHKLTNEKKSEMTVTS